VSSLLAVGVHVPVVVLVLEGGGVLIGEVVQRGFGDTLEEPLLEVPEGADEVAPTRRR
jgi:hypothetical protein